MGTRKAELGARPVRRVAPRAVAALSATILAACSHAPPASAPASPRPAGGAVAPAPGASAAAHPDAHAPIDPPDAAAAAGDPPDTELPPGARLDAAWFVVVGSTAAALGCFDGASRTFLRGGACARGLPAGADLVARGARVRARGEATFTCAPTDETFPGVRIDRELPQRVLAVWSRGRAGTIAWVAAPGGVLQADLDGDRTIEKLAVGADGLFLSRASAAPVQASDRSRTGRYAILGTADALADGRLEVFSSWDYGHGWGFAASTLVGDELRSVGLVECGS